MELVLGDEQEISVAGLRGVHSDRGNRGNSLFKALKTQGKLVHLQSSTYV